MANTPEKKPRGPDRPGLSRREVLIGAAATAVAVSARSIAAAPRDQHATARTTAPLKRYMAAAAMLGDGRILITGGYDTPWIGKQEPRAMSSAVIFDPHTGEYTVAAQMRVPRARHAAIALRDGRVAVLGGVGLSPTASVEVYDPASNTWQVSAPLAQPRYDHVAVYDGNTVYVLGGSAQSMLASVEAVYPGATTAF